MTLNHEAAARRCTAWEPSGRLWEAKAELRRWTTSRTARRALLIWNIIMTAVVVGLLVTT